VPLINITVCLDNALHIHEMQKTKGEWQCINDRGQPMLFMREEVEN
jgi:hypothetical protein